MVTMKFSEISGFPFAQALQKISQTPTHGQKASLILRIIRAVDKARGEIQKEYQKEIAEVFGKRDAEGNLIRVPGAPFEPIEEKVSELEVAQQVFSEKEIGVDCPMITLDTISDVKISASDLAALKALYEGNPEAISPKLQIVT